MAPKLLRLNYSCRSVPTSFLGKW